VRSGAGVSGGRRWQLGDPPVATAVTTAAGGSVRGAIQRGISGGPLNFAPFLFIGQQGPSVNDLGYILGLGDGETSFQKRHEHVIVLVGVYFAYLGLK
jgi:hypothetical protein